MSNAEVFATFAREHGLNTERVESARQKGVKMLTLVQLVTSRPAVEVDVMLLPVVNGEIDADTLAGQAQTLVNLRSAR